MVIFMDAGAAMCMHVMSMSACVGSASSTFMPCARACHECHECDDDCNNLRSIISIVPILAPTGKTLSSKWQQERPSH